MQTQTKVVFSYYIRIISKWGGMCMESEGTYWILKLRVHLSDDCAHGFQLGEHIFLGGSLSAHHVRHLNEDG
jgi:hypothetical protein